MEPRLFENSLTAYRVRTELLGVSAYTAGQTKLKNIAATKRRERRKYVSCLVSSNFPRRHHSTSENGTVTAREMPVAI